MQQTFFKVTFFENKVSNSEKATVYYLNVTDFRIPL